MFQVAELVTSEFFEQGDRERAELKLTPSAIFDRNRKDELPRLQLEWIDSICMPLYQVSMIQKGLCVWTKPGKKNVCASFSEVLVSGHPSRLCMLPGTPVTVSFSRLRFLFFFLFGPHLQHMEVPRLGVESEV
uniref:PDEase domain-containing protein n=1 Tax=Sus scrofa TaxID=9823 RepID=A0A8D1ZHS3_PIG